MHRPEQHAYPLLDLYLKRRENLFTDLGEMSLPDATLRVSKFIHELERPYTDLPGVTDIQSRLAPHVLRVIAAGAQFLTAVIATLTPAKPGISRTQSAQSARRRFGRIRTTRVFYLWGLTAACVAAIILTLVSDSAIVPIVSLVIIAILATAAAVASQSRDGPLGPPQPNITLSPDVGAIDGKLTTALRAADDLLELAVRKLIDERADSPRFESDRVLELLQALAAHRIAGHPEKSADDLAGDAIRLLRAARVTPVAYRTDQARNFDEQPAGISEIRTLLPALVDEEGNTVRKGVVLVPL